MFKNNLKLIIRKLRKEKLYSFVNIAGLTVGLTAFLLIALYVRDELSFDNFHENKENIYRVISSENGEKYKSTIASDFVEFFREDIPQIDGHTRVAGGRVSLLNFGERNLNVDNVLFVDSNFFEFFDFALLNANRKTVFSETSQVVITQSLREKLFGDTNPIGQEIQMNKGKVYTVAAVAADPPKNSTIQFEMLVYERGYFKNVWEEMHSVRNITTYVSIVPSASKEVVSAGITKAIDKPVYRDMLEGYTYELLPYTDQRLYAPYQRDGFQKNDIRYITLFSGIGLVVLLLALINYVNLVTAQSMRRVKEIGLRKVIGANKAQLIFNQLSESVVITLISFVFAFAIAERLLPFYNQLLDKSITLQYGGSEFFMWVFMAGLALGILAGLYPAFYISKFKPLALLNKTTAAVGHKGYLRKFLVLFQFVSSGLLLVVLAIMFSQMNYLKTTDLGFNPDLVIQVPLYSDIQGGYQTLKNEAERIGGIKSASATGWTVGNSTSSSFFDGPDRENEETKAYRFHLVYADKDYPEILELKFLQKAENFDSKEFNQGQMIVTQSLVDKMGWAEAPLGRRVYSSRGEPMDVVAVIDDFHTFSLKQEIEPMFIIPIMDRGANSLLLKMDAVNGQKALQEFGEVYERMAQRPFEFYYLDDKIKAFYKKEQGQFMLFQVFSGLAVFISLLGLIALTIYMVEQRRKEVSIRKVLGASIKSLILMLNKEYTLLVVLAFLIASPIAYYAMQGWLAEFKYRIEITPLIFIGAFLSFLALSWMMTLLQSLQVSKANPADTLREE
tara:strand:- start:305 stop:2665 length:2361 start_codon:yes stop_codon:yes gene_type:complete